MPSSPFVKPCEKCNGSGKTGDINQMTEICSECNGAQYKVDYAYLRLFEHKIWEVSSNEKAPYLSLVQDIHEGIESVKSLPDYPKGFLSRLYHIRGNLFEFLVALDDQPVYFIEAMRSLIIADQLDDNVSEDG